MKVIVNTACFIAGKLVEPGAKGAAIAVSDKVGKLLVATGRGSPATAKQEKGGK